MARLISDLKVVSAVLCVCAMSFAPHGMAQTNKLGDAQVPLQRPRLSLVGSGCPVSIKADQRASTQRIETGAMVSAKPTQGVTVTIADFRALRITSAEIVAHALSAKIRSVPTGRQLEPDVTRSFHLVAKADGDFSSDLLMEDVTSIRWIELESVTYSDGSAWQESETQSCSVRPNPMVLVSVLR